MIVSFNTEGELTLLKVGQQFADHFSVSERIFQQNLHDYGSVFICSELFYILDKTREFKKEPMILSSLNRSEKKQQQLITQGARAAQSSPHVVKLAADIDCSGKADTLRTVQFIREAMQDTGIKCRIGFQKYLAVGQTLVHVDVCPEYFAEGEIWHTQLHPKVWEQALEF